MSRQQIMIHLCRYPKADLEQFWKMIALIQFHDVMSGSAIEMVYDDCLQVCVVCQHM